MEDFNEKDLININTMKTFKAKPRILKVDTLVSKAIGKTVYVNNSKLIQKIVEWKRKGGDKDIQVNNNKVIAPASDNFLDDPKKIEELKAIL